ncbi:MAG: type IV pilus modification PilV family protein [Tumebacillaceae bacterium]
MLRAWKTESGVTLVELMAAIVVLGIVVIPFTNIGTTIWKQYALDSQTNEAVLLAEQKLDEARNVLETGNTLSAQQLEGVGEDELVWSITVSTHAMSDPGLGPLTDVTVTVTRPESLHPATTNTLVTLSTVVRKKG